MRVFVTLSTAALVLLTAVAFSGTTGKIAGTVRDARTGEPLPSVNVVIDGTTLGAATNPDGYFAIINIPPGRYKVTAALVGYKPTSAVNVANLRARSPSGSPCPKVSGCLDSLLASAQDIRPAAFIPAAGRIPTRRPMSDERRIFSG